MIKQGLLKTIIHIRKYLSDSKNLRDDYKKVILVMQITLLGILACILLSLVYLFQALYSNAIISISALIIFSTSLILIYVGKINISKSIILIYSSLSIALSSPLDGRSFGNDFYWFPIIGGVFLFFSLKDKFYIFLCFSCIMASMVYIEVSNYPFELSIPTKPYKFIVYLISFCFSIAMISLYLYYLIKANSYSERKLQRLNKILINRNDNLKKINNELDSFVYKASHDMRAPLTSLLGLVSLSKKEEDILVIKNFLEMQEKTISKLDGYIGDILNMSRNSRMEILNTEVNFKYIINQIFDQLYFLDNCTLVNKKITVNESTPLITDPIRLNVILNNLISNSIRYADFSKTNPTISILVNCNNRIARIEIEDNGIGIPPEHLKNVFNMFYRATDKNSGSGLGLYIVKETLNKLKGTIEIQSELGRFTKVIVEIPNNI